MPIHINELLNIVMKKNKVAAATLFHEDMETVPREAVLRHWYLVFFSTSLHTEDVLSGQQIPCGWLHVRYYQCDHICARDSDIPSFKVDLAGQNRFFKRCTFARYPGITHMVMLKLLAKMHFGGQNVQTLDENMINFKIKKSR
jgi:hypothetical protein